MTVNVPLCILGIMSLCELLNKKGGEDVRTVSGHGGRQSQSRWLVQAPIPLPLTTIILTPFLLRPAPTSAYCATTWRTTENGIKERMQTMTFGSPHPEGTPTRATRITTATANAGSITTAYAVG